jgi:hypothetical protein
MTIAIAQRFTHPNFTLARAIIPAVIHKVDAIVYRISNDSYRFDICFGISQMAAPLYRSVRLPHQYVQDADMVFRSH